LEKTGSPWGRIALVIGRGGWGVTTADGAHELRTERTIREGNQKVERHPHDNNPSTKKKKKKKKRLKSRSAHRNRK